MGGFDAPFSFGLFGSDQVDPHGPFAFGYEIKLAGGLDCPSGQCSSGYTNADLVGTGTMALGVVALPAAGVPVFPLSGPFGSKFVLAGGITYGPLIQAGVAPHFEPVLGGGLSNGGQWLACYQSLAPKGCAPPGQGPIKKYASDASDAASVGALASVEFPPVAVGLSVFSLVCDVISLDPPDPHFKQAAHPLHLRGLTVRAGRGLSRRAARVLNQVDGALARAGSEGSAYIDAWQRYQGAERAKNPRYTFAQLNSALRYGHQLVSGLRNAASVLARAHRALAATLLARRRISGAKLAAELRRVRRHGLPDALARRLSRLGLPATTLRTYARKLDTRVPRGVHTALGTILSSRFDSEVALDAKLLALYLNSLPQ